MLKIKEKDFNIREVVYVKWIEDDVIFECAGELIKLEEGNLSIGFNFHSDNILDIIKIKTGSILEIEKNSI